MVNSIEVEGLCVRSNRETLLDSVSFTLAAGERKGLIGASGCGKSLTASALCGLLRPPLRATAGRIMLHGHEVMAYSPKEWRAVRGRHIFQIFQSPGTALTLARRIGPQLTEVARISLAGDPKRTVAQALQSVALDESVAQLFPYQLSGGMKQRVLIAMALILRPRILIADEPTTGLDVLTEHDILTSLNKMIEQTGAALLFISHDLRFVREVAPRTLVMHSGKVLEEIPVHTLDRSAHAATRGLAEAAAVLTSTC